MKKIYMSGVKPTLIHLGHIITIIQHGLSSKEKDNYFYLIADLHSYSHLYHGQEEIKYLTHSTIQALSYTGCKFYLQSNYQSFYAIYHLLLRIINQHALEKLYHINFGHSQDNMFKYFYPVLMILDVIFVQPCIIVVGIDQIHNVRFIKQHIEILNSMGAGIDVDFETIETKVSIGGKKMSSSIGSDALFVTDTQGAILSKILKIKTHEKYPSSYEEVEKLGVQELFSIFDIVKEDNMRIEGFCSYQKIKEYIAHRTFLKLNQFNRSPKSIELQGMTERYKHNLELLTKILSKNLTK